MKIWAIKILVLALNLYFLYNVIKIFDFESSEETFWYVSIVTYLIIIFAFGDYIVEDYKFYGLLLFLFIVPYWLIDMIFLMNNVNPAKGTTMYYLYLLWKKLMIFLAVFPFVWAYFAFLNGTLIKLFGLKSNKNYY